MSLTAQNTESLNSHSCLYWPELGTFARRHLGPSITDVRAMLDQLGLASVEQLAQAAVPASIQLTRPLDLPPARSEASTLLDLQAIARRNQICRSFIGLGYHDCHTPAVIQRNILENPGWYTQYTPYQAEISQGRLEGLLLFQTMICELSGLDIANASLLDEATAAAEAMQLCHRCAADPKRRKFFIADTCHPQNMALVQTRAQALGLEPVAGAAASFAPDSTYFGALVQYPDTLGIVEDWTDWISRCHQAGIMVAMAADPLALVLLKTPGECGADVVIGSAQRFGVPLGFGGPHAAFMATRDTFKRQLPGRLVGVSKDSRGKAALRLSLGTREQHIRREKATSNICTAQALLANMAAMFAVYHGPEGLRRIAQRLHQQTRTLAAALLHLGHNPGNRPFFDTLTVALKPGITSATIHERARAHRINLRELDANRVGIALDETVENGDLIALLEIFSGTPGQARAVAEDIRQANLPTACIPEIPATLARSTACLKHPWFNRYHSETEMLRYLRRLESRDLSLTTSMIPLGSCTMKLNAACEMFPVSWPEFAKLHPFAPASQTQGYRALFDDLETWLAELTGFAAVSLQPNAGSQGEYAGLLAIRAWHHSRGQSGRSICLIPASAHGTNPASAAMAGMRIVAVACDALGNIDVADLRKKAADYSNELSVLMVTYPSTHGVFEADIREVCGIVHQHGGQVYMDGANLNAQVGLCRPGDIGADVCHMNLHKTFCIPHGGGGPGMGPIAVAKHLAPFLPGHPVSSVGGPQAIGAVSAAAWGSASILPVSWVYIAAMGPDGLKLATQIAILNANYMAARLQPFFPVLYRGPGGWVAHECIIDLRQFKLVSAEDVAKRLMDYGFHAPTLSFPVAGTLMIEPTESESKAELDRFCDAMVSIHAEILAVEEGRADRSNNVLKGAPHTADMIAAENWNRPYTRDQAAYPAPWLRDHKFWPVSGRIDNVHGDRNLVCSCAGMDLYT